MRSSIALLALGGTLAAAAAAAAPADSSMIMLYYWGFFEEMPEKVQGAVIDSKRSATTVELTCGDGSDPGGFCILPADPMTVIQGPSTYHVAMSSTAFDDMGDLKAAQTVDCTVKDSPQTITCTNTIVYTYSGTTETVTAVSTRHNFYDYNFSVNITSGFDKLTSALGSTMPPAPAATPTGKTSVLGIFYPQDDSYTVDANDLPQGAVASVVDADAAATTYAVRCPPGPINRNHRSSCELGDEEVTFTYGPSTFRYSQEIMLDYMHDTLIFDCSVNESDVATCTESYTYAMGPSITTGSNVATLSGYKTRTFDVTATAGLEKLTAVPGATVIPTAQVTGSPAASSTGKPTGKPDAANAAGQANARGALIAGAAASAFLGFVLML